MPEIAPAPAPSATSATSATGTTKEEFMRDPSLSNLSDDMKEKVWENYKKIMGMK
jgi:hypothetical protein